jgi:bifunctional UDP-N-acetylglucosamine pyrophosphorylase/glucosamine-1-phosphate N-acetyltransferase
MRSKLPKVLHPVVGKPMIWYALQTVHPLVDLPPVIVVGHGADAVREFVGARADFVLQEAQLGTGHAVACA